MGAHENLSILDFVLLPFVLTFVYIIAYRIRNKRYPYSNPLRKYYMSALTLKIIGAIFIGLIYAYYYTGGDTYYFFNQAQVLNSSFNESFVKWINLLLHIPSANNPDYYNYTSQMEWYNDPSSYTVVSVTAFISMFTLNTYLPTAVIFAFISFTGIWALFKTFTNLYPHLIRPVAIAILFIPSTIVWGSGIFKDTLCLSALGWLTYAIFRFLLQKDYSGKNVAIVILSFILLATVKIYILIGFAPALLMWVFFNYSKKIKNKFGKLLTNFFLLGIGITGFIIYMQSSQTKLGKYSLENLAETSNVTREWIHYASGDEGSSYTLGKFDQSLVGTISKFPLAVNVTLFRPYIWESKKILIFLSSIEAFIFLFITLKVLFSIRLAKIWSTIRNDPTIQFCLVFSIIFAFAVGISSYNFGALSRYKIPCLPFYALAILLIYYKNYPKKNLWGKII